MKRKNLCINVEDITLLSELLRVAGARYEKHNAHLKTLRAELDHALVVLPNQMPPDIVTRYSQVLLRDLETGAQMKYVLVFPEDTDLTAGRISVLEPIGAAIVGRQVGHSIQVDMPTGVRKMRIERLLYQPEAAAIEIVEERGLLKGESPSTEEYAYTVGDRATD